MSSQVSRGHRLTCKRPTVEPGQILSPSVWGQRCVTPALLRGLTGSFSHLGPRALTLMWWWAFTDGAALRRWGWDGGLETCRAFVTVPNHTSWLTERVPSGSLPSGQERVSPPSRLQKAISPRDTMSHEPPVQSKTHGQGKEREVGWTHTVGAIWTSSHCCYDLRQVWLGLRHNGCSKVTACGEQAET